ncbi:PREDICTED: antichymotrypsin-2 isoform X1 [Papilio xuthus]|uniref:Antichymotrypsin-2 isoform X1 n=1 Tax=Papilio xuthus TaxID=66420 RepID=A0AAJ6Z5W5_PAPXU|nr:PREDICTED: antichymotrypsin-2 isoform X1 [Papilio xuthus]
MIIVQSPADRKMRQLLVLCLALGFSNALWLRQGRSDQPKDTRFVGEATNELSTTIFQGYIDDSNNLAFSPLGYAAILAILAEGAKGETKNQLVSALHLPENPNLTRTTFRYIMERLKNTNEYKYNQPELKNFFYIYKNYTINEDYKKILEDYYLTEVRSVERYHSELNKSDDDSEVTETKEDNETKDEISEPLALKDPEEKYITFAMEDKPEKVDVSHVGYKPAKNIKEKIKLVKAYAKKEKEESEDEEETMVAVEARNSARSLKILHDKNDISSIVSVNSVGKKSGKPSKSNSLMIIFNGMYFRGSWKQPFEVVEPGVFYKSNTIKKQVPMMKTTGTFKTSSLPDLDSEALMLPYDGGRYALLVVVPRSRDGLTRLIADLPSVPIADIQETMIDEELQVSLPSFYVETTTKPVAALAKFGVSNIFSREAELSGVSEDEGLFVQELVQHVAVRVDNAHSAANELSAANPGIESLKNAPFYEERSPRRFCVEHPFIFYIMDRLDNLVVVAGKVTDPQQPTTFEV